MRTVGFDECGDRRNYAHNYQLVDISTDKLTQNFYYFANLRFCKFISLQIYVFVEANNNGGFRLLDSGRKQVFALILDLY